MEVDGVPIRDSFAEAFPMHATRIIVTAADRDWLAAAASTATGFATSVIACGVEAGIERWLEPAATPDGRPGVALLFFSMSRRTLESQLIARVGQCILTCPTTACYAGIGGEHRLPLGKSLRFFGDGHQIPKKLGDRRFWRIPVMEGEFICEHDTGLTAGIGGGNFLILARDGEAASRAARRAVAAMAEVPGIVLPFPGGVVRSGSKVGSRYPKLTASTNDAYCPTLRGRVTRTALPPDVGAVLEIVIDGLDAGSIRAGMRAGILAACERGKRRGVIAIDAGNYGGRLGPHHFHLREVLAA